MAPILGIYASQISGHLFAPSGAYDSIATTTVGSGGASSITFSSIPSTYTHLQLRYIARTLYAGAADSAVVQVNGSTANSYTIHYLYGDGTSAAAAATAPYTFTYAGYLPGATVTANVFGVAIVDLLDASNTSKYKTIRSLNGMDANGSGNARLTSGLIQDTSAISSIKLTADNGSNFAQYSHFALYGIRGGN
jgi:hypothetical protein